MASSAPPPAAVEAATTTDDQQSEGSKLRTFLGILKKYVPSIPVTPSSQDGRDRTRNPQSANAGPERSNTTKNVPAAATSEPRR